MNNHKQTLIQPKRKLFDLKLGEAFASHELIWLFVKRDFAAAYKQTILGPLWFILKPLLTTLVFTVVFGQIASLPTDKTPQFLFYMAANILWSYYSVCVTKISNTFVSNARLFGKVYFPRIISPISVSLSNMINFAVQFAMFIIFVIYYTLTGAASPNWYVLLSPILVIMCALLAIGIGCTVSSLTTKYKDLSVLVSFGVTLWMYISPVVYPASKIPSKYLALYMLNPISPIIEAFRYAFLGAGMFSWFYLAVSLLIILAVLMVGLILFNRAEATFTDTI